MSGGIKITGGCLCGAVRYEATEEPVNGGYCHCSLCQKISGGFHTVMIKFPNSGFSFTKGEPSYYHTSELQKRGFCAGCGSSIVGVYEGDSNVFIAIGSLDHPENWSMDREGWWGHIYVADKIPWETIADGLPQVDETISGSSQGSALDMQE